MSEYTVDDANVVGHLGLELGVCDLLEQAQGLGVLFLMEKKETFFVFYVVYVRVLRLRPYAVILHQQLVVLFNGRLESLEPVHRLSLFNVRLQFSRLDPIAFPIVSNGLGVLLEQKINPCSHEMGFRATLHLQPVIKLWIV